MAFGRSERGLRARAGGGRWVGTTRLVHGNDAARGEGARAARARAVRAAGRGRAEEGARRRRRRGGGRARGGRVRRHMGCGGSPFGNATPSVFAFCPLTDIGRKVRPKASVFLRRRFLPGTPTKFERTDASTTATHSLRPATECLRARGRRLEMDELRVRHVLFGDASASSEDPAVGLVDLLHQIRWDDGRSFRTRSRA